MGIVIALLLGVTVLAFAADRMLACFYPCRPALLFPPLSRVHYRTLEYDFVAQINSIGLRDREFTVQRSSSCRVLAIGDSFCYGWGVEQDESWPKRLERNLLQLGFNVEVLNLGSPGASPADYAAVAERAIPMLRPDLVITCILEGEDVAQMLRDAPEIRPFSRVRLRVRRILRAMFPTLLCYLRPRPTGGLVQADDITAEWRQQAADMVARLTPRQRERWSKIDPVTQEGMLKGMFAPEQGRDPDFYLATLDLRSPRMQKVLERLAASLACIQSIAYRYGCKTMFISVPMGFFVCEKAYGNHEHLGYSLDPVMLSSDAGSAPVGIACERIGLRLLTFDEELRRIARKGGPSLYFETDTHFTAEGQRVYAELITPVVASSLQTLGVVPGPST